jgi:PBP1b-binding outer membrane lipoprotein LpoB
MKKILPTRHAGVTTTLARVAILIAATVFLAGCGSRLSGTYKVDSNGGIPFEKITFTSGSKVELTTAMTEATTEATYVVEGDKVKISAAGMTQIFTIDKNGCLNGGEMIGKFCKQ